MTRLVLLLALALAAGPAFAQTTEPSATAAFKDDVHAAAGIACVACHKDAAPGRYAPITRTAIAPMCATCHSDAAYMQRFAPQVRVDQFLQYQTSTHGKRMAEGETRVATCSDCHGAHGVRRVRDSRSPVAPLNVAMTCARCHGDEARMTAFGRDALPPEDWMASSHAAALFKRGDTSAPTCASCHGSHGATPPGVTAVANVCAQCHVREAELFRTSPKKEIFDALGLAECIACHNNHRIVHPEDTWVGVQEGAVCAHCHDGSGDSGQTVVTMRTELDRLSTSLAEADVLLTGAERAGVSVDEGRQRLREGRDHLVQSRALVHSFSLPTFAKASAEGLASAGAAHEAGEAAVSELRFRRSGLAVATLLILAFLATLWFKIRRLPPPMAP